MQPITLSNDVLNELCITIAKSKQFYYPESNYYFTDLYLTGCRSTELLDISRWNRINDVYELTTLKTEAKRIIPQHFLSDNFKQAHLSGNRPYNALTYDQLTLEMRKVTPMHPIWSGKRIADTYLFRYNRARQHFTVSQNIFVTMDFFGWLSTAIATNYVYTPLIFDSDRRL